MRITLSIRAYITVLAIGTVLPFLAFSAFLVASTATEEQELIAQTVRNTADGTAGDLSRQLGALQSLVHALADVRALQTGDLAGFYEESTELVRRQHLTAVLYDPTGQQLVNTSVPFGMPLPKDPDAVRAVLETGKEVISDLIRPPQTEEWTVRIAMPVLRDSALGYVLTLYIQNALAAVIDAQIVLPQQRVGLSDRQGTIIYRSPDPRPVIGLKAPDEFLTGIAGHDEGAFPSVSRSGVPIHIAFKRMEATGWVVGVSIPRHVLFAPVHDSLLRLAWLGAGTVLLAMLIAWAIGRAITRPVTALSRLASTLGTGTTITEPQPTPLREVNAVAATMLAETEQLREQTEQRERAAKALEVEVASRRRIEQQLLQSQKIEAIGQLTGGLAHDFNNLLAIIIGNLDALRERWSSDRESDELTGAALEAALRGADLTRQMLAFARRQPLAPEVCDLSRVIRSIVRLLRRTLGEDITIELQLASILRPVLVDRAQFGAAITNLATNARDAMPGGGQLKIATRTTYLDGDYAATHAEVVPGEYVLIEVSDNGTGMTPAVVERIFEPFFTTKEPGHGTGLGLSMVFGFLKQSGGHISAYSELAQGTTFRLYLPPAADAALAAEPITQAVPEPGHNETILAVEDNDRLRQILSRQLTSAGYRVLEANNARMALETLGTDVAIDLLLTDIIMPGGMNGHELAIVATRQRPRLKMLLTTGFSDLATGNVASDLRILRKPYRKDDLLRLVRETLDC